MRRSTFLVILAGGLAVAACSTDQPINSTSDLRANPTGPANVAAADAEVPVVSPVLADLDARLAASGSNLRVARAEILIDGDAQQFGSQVLIASDRARGLGYEWVNRDPRRGGHAGLTYAFDPIQGRNPYTRNPDGSGLRQMPFSELDPQLEEAMSTWRDLTCSSAPVDRVPVPAGVDPDLIDQLLLGTDGAGRTWQQISDLVQAGWQHPNFFTALAGPSGSNIIGVTISFWFVDANGDPTDINGDGKYDTALAEIYYNTTFAWGNSGALNVVDTWSITSHETGHGFGLAHFGSVFVTKRDAANGISISDVKYAPRALMNAVYVTGRSPFTGSDNSSFCMIWGSKN